MNMEEIFESVKESLETSGNEIDQQPPTESEENETSSVTLVKNDNVVLTRFRAIVAEYLNGEIVESLNGLTREILGSYSLAGYLDFAVPSGKEIIVTKLLQQCCFLLQDLLRLEEFMTIQSTV